MFVSYRMRSRAVTNSHDGTVHDGIVPCEYKSMAPGGMGCSVSTIFVCEHDVTEHVGIVPCVRTSRESAHERERESLLGNNAHDGP